MKAGILSSCRKENRPQVLGITKRHLVKTEMSVFESSESSSLLKMAT